MPQHFRKKLGKEFFLIVSELTQEVAEPIQQYKANIKKKVPSHLPH